ncbi:caspase family protein [Candidatus Fermentibacteria bacterium]|nr:caspase family protein [Candidatus Fermentibacteria bacterium]
MIGAAILILATLLPSADSAGQETFSVKRFMLVAGANDGGSDRVPLRYAASDAQTVARVFQELGGVDRADQHLLLNPDTATLLEAVSCLGTQIDAARNEHARVELFVYYSGHSDEDGLLLGGEMLSYRELKAAVDEAAADVRVIILDSCASGALTRLKGGARRAPFLIDASAQMKGHAFLTASSYDEAAQESDRIGASYFTHALVSGLRGAADMTQDKRVTLNEAYQFAFYETMARTEGTQGGTQHPAYDIQMAGAGDLVLTDLRGTTAGLELGEGLTGRLRVRDGAGALVVELQKPPGRVIELGMEPGEYRVILERDGAFYGTDVVLSDGRRKALESESFSFMSSERTTIRGDGPAAPPALVTDPVQRPVLYRSFLASLWPGMSTATPYDDRVVSTFSVHLTLGRSYGVKGLALGYLGNWTLGDMSGLQVAQGMNLVEGDVNGIQAAGLFNRVNGRLRYGQVGAFLNWAGGTMDGVQFGGLGNVLSSRGRGAQIAWGFNVSRERFSGFQSAVLANYAGGEFEGFQFSYLANLVTGHMEGFQFSLTFNDAASMRGAQLSLINLAGHANGCQLGLVNVAGSVRGTQVGIINVANSVSGAPIGLINYVRDGRRNLTLWAGDVPDLGFGVKLGNQYAYSLLHAAGDWVEGRDRLLLGAGLGAHIPVRGHFATVEALSSVVLDDGRWPDRLHMLHTARIGMGLHLFRPVSLVGGATFNVYTSRLNDGRGFAKGTWYDGHPRNTWVKAWPGFYLGLQL